MRHTFVGESTLKLAVLQTRLARVLPPLLWVNGAKILHVTERVRTFVTKYYPKFLDNTLIKLRFTSVKNVRTDILREQW